jgi:predicted dehydrogenase
MSRTRKNKAAADRRDFLKISAATTGTLLAGSVLNKAHAAGDDTIKVGLIGCGGRGSGAIQDCLKSSKNVKVVAVGDAFKLQASNVRKMLMNRYSKMVDLPEDRCFGGLDAYQRVIESGVDLVILATPPGFRPVHLEAAVKAGKHVFTEKPVAVDGPGIRKCLEVYEEAKKKNLAIVAGTQRRHQTGYLETMKRIHDGAIGDIVGARCYWNGSGIWFRRRDELKQFSEPATDVAYQLHNWYHFVWVCGDHIVEQHVHNLDVINWAMNGHPVKCWAMGGRSNRPAGDPNEVGHIFDHFAVEYEYANGVRMFSFCRQIPGCFNSVSEALVGTKGTCQVDQYSINGTRLEVSDNAPYVQEHTDLIASIRNGTPLNELKTVAESTLTAVMGRISAYTGKPITWEQALKSTDDTFPAKLTWDMALPVKPVAIVGRGKIV